ncbi:PoNi-like cognate immunity protein [Capnocytophaga canimorsus]|uniref:PoNi-like cognate immunity protein n=1 Tax=Capnocytophaga canimorsus TaxID=28188 RepID=UPI00156259CE|nr:PoNi-like cognate immunity protein [Capnocytophaga canimorsus]
MIIRDNFNTIERYQELIRKKKSYILEDKQEIADLLTDEAKGIQKYPKANLEVISSIKDTILKNSYDILLCSYSMGDKLENVKEQYLATLESMQGVWRQSNGYVQMVWMLSIGTMLDADETIFEKFKSLVEKDNPNDYLIDFLLSSKTDWQMKNTTFKFPEPYAALKEVIDLASDNQKEKATQRLKKYLDKEWYKGHSDTGWHNSHKSKHNIYTGYWSFESGALVKILGLDDTLLKDQKYYPYDMVN